MYGRKIVFLHDKQEKMAEHNNTGKWGEQTAAAYLRRKGYTIREMDWHYGHRDIDIVALTEDMRTLVFVEVKTRTDSYFRRPEEAVDMQKIRNIALAANAYVKMNKVSGDMRFDIITVVGNGNRQEEPVIEHWEAAFNPLLAF